MCTIIETITIHNDNNSDNKNDNSNNNANNNNNNNNVCVSAYQMYESM